VTCVYHLYGWFQALLSIPRQVWANFINAAAVLRALRQYLNYLRTGVLLKWDKTAHVFPSEAELAVFHKKLGDLLVERDLISTEQLQAAIAWQKKVQRPLGTLLVRMGALGEDELTESLSGQLRLPFEKLDPAAITPDLAATLPRALAVRYSAVPVRVLEDDRLLIAVADRLKPQQVVDLESALGRKVALCLTTRSELGQALRMAYSHEDEEPAGPYRERAQEAGVFPAGYRRLGDILLDEEMVSVAELDTAVKGYATAAPQLFGEYLLGIGAVTPAQLQLALELQSTCGPQAGEEDAGASSEKGRRGEENGND
jgi:adsorption protein B